MLLPPALLLTLVLGGAADDLMSARVGPLNLKVPAIWKHHLEDGSQKYVAPSGDAYFLLDIGQTAAPLDPGLCRKKILDKMGDAGRWTLLSIGAAPAASKVDVDRSDDGQTEAQTLTYVGCDGRTTWSLVFHLAAGKKERFAPLADRIAKSLEYVHAPR